MANRAGLKKVTKTVRGKKGSVRRSYWVKSEAPVSATGFVKKHAGRLAGNFAGGFVGGVVHAKDKANMHPLANIQGALIGSGIGMLINHGKGSASMRRDISRMSFGGKAATAIGIGAIGMAGHAAGFAAHNRIMGSGNIDQAVFQHFKRYPDHLRHIMASNHYTR